jgi:RND family efflux transporter MFP subunit
MSGKGLSWTVCLSLCVLAITGSAGCRGGEEQVPVQRPQLAGVTVQAVARRPVGDAFEGSGTVKTDRTSTIASRVMGTVTSLKVREGDPVKAGELLMTIDDRDATERSKAAAMAVETARVNRDLARTTWARYKSLYDQKALTSQEMDQEETRLKVAEAEYSRARAMAGEAAAFQGFTRITAPFAGRVVAKRIDAGSMASPGMPLLTIEGDGDRYVEVSVDESLSGKITAGLPAEVIVDSLGRTLQGRIREIVPAVDPGSRTFLVKVSVDDQGLRSGVFTRVRIPLDNRSALLVPQKAVVSKGQLTGVYTVDDKGLVTYRLIRTGRRFGSEVEVLSGLDPNERIITSGAEKAADGGIIAAEAPK